MWSLKYVLVDFGTEVYFQIRNYCIQFAINISLWIEGPWFNSTAEDDQIWV